MDNNAKLKYIETIEKDLTQICFAPCFKKMKTDMDCVRTCYDKYIFGI